MLKKVTKLLVLVFTVVTLAGAYPCVASAQQTKLVYNYTKFYTKGKPTNTDRCRIDCEPEFVGPIAAGGEYLIVSLYMKEYAKPPGGKYKRWAEVLNAVNFENVTGNDVVSAEKNEIILRLKLNSKGTVTPRFAADIVRNTKRYPVKHSVHLGYKIADKISSKKAGNAVTGVYFYSNPKGNIVLRPGQKHMTVNGKKVPLSTPAVEKKGEDYLPAVAVAKAFGCEIDSIWVSTQKKPVSGNLYLNTVDGKALGIVVPKKPDMYSTYWKTRTGKKIPYNRYIAVEDYKEPALSNERHTYVMSPTPIYAVRDSVNKVEFMVPAQTIAQALGVNFRWNGKQVILSAKKVE